MTAEPLTFGPRVVVFQFRPPLPFPITAHRLKDPTAWRSPAEVAQWAWANAATAPWLLLALWVDRQAAIQPRRECGCACAGVLENQGVCVSVRLGVCKVGCCSLIPAFGCRITWETSMHILCYNRLGSSTNDGWYPSLGDLLVAAVALCCTRDVVGTLSRTTDFVGLHLHSPVKYKSQTAWSQRY